MCIKGLFAAFGGKLLNFVVQSRIFMLFHTTIFI